MDYRGLYKAGGNNILNSTAKTKRSNKVNKERSTKRNTLFLNGRDMKECSVHENDSVHKKPNNNFTKLTKQKAYMARFLEWKAEKERKLKEAAKKEKPKPFISTVKGSLAATNFIFEAPKKSKNTSESINIKSKKCEAEEQKMFRKPLVPKNVLAPIAKTKKSAISKLKKDGENSINGKKFTSVKGECPSNGLLKPKIIKEEKCTPLKVEAKKQDDVLPNFYNCLTSTGRKSLNPNLLCIEFFGDAISPVDTDFPVAAVTKNAATPPKEEQIIQCETVPPTLGNVITKIPETLGDLNVTPINEKENETSNYMSPFVTISRGKVSIKKEREKRESIYKLEESSPCDHIEVRRTRESVKYFRKLLNDEISRLHIRCDFWDEYKLENENKIEEVGFDMINATVGQTRLLTSKKLEQFRGLIDRCEQGLVKNVKQENSEQAILPEDLEGFWSMVQLQIENVDKRFEDLKRWKENKWIDPDEQKPKPKKNLLSKVTKTKKAKPIKPNEHLMGLLKKAQAAYKNNKDGNNARENDVIFVQAKRRSKTNRRSTSNTPERRTSRRVEATVIDYNTKESSSKRRKSVNINTSRNSTPRRSDVKARRSLLANTLNKVHERKSLGRLLKNSPQLTAPPRKSILKTPGTARKEKQKVFFNEQLDYNSPEYMTGIEVLSEDDNEMRRSMHLRSRRVLLRPDNEILIP